MHFFRYRNGQLYAEDVPVEKIAEKYGTPLYIYSYHTLLRHFKAYDEAFDGVPHIICFALKANSNIAILRLFAKQGGGADVVSGGEIFKALKAGISSRKIVYAGVGKTEEEIKAAIGTGILFFNVESVEELHVINDIAKGLGNKARIALRVNPDIDPKTHPYISTGLKKSKFGIEISKALDVYKGASRMEGIEVVGIDAHIGSQIFQLDPFVESLRKLIELGDALKNEGITIQYIDIGGGLGISYKEGEMPPHPKEYADVIKREISGTPYKLVLEPGRALVGNAGILVTKVLYIKDGVSKKFVVVDAAMNDLIRPAFYDSYHEIISIDERLGDEETVDIVGPVCESGDFFAKDRGLPKVKRGDLLAILSAGAYGFVMSSNYNTRPRVPEVMVRGEEFFVVRGRETYEDLFKGEIIPDFMK